MLRGEGGKNIARNVSPSPQNFVSVLANPINISRLIYFACLFYNH